MIPWPITKVELAIAALNAASVVDDDLNQIAFHSRMVTTSFWAPRCSAPTLSSSSLPPSLRQSQGSREGSAPLTSLQGGPAGVPVTWDTGETQ